VSCFDPYIARRSIIHRLDPRAKLIAITVLAAAIVLIPSAGWILLGAYLSFILLLIFLARLPLSLIPRRVLVTLPFTLPAALFLPFFPKVDSLSIWQLGYWHLSYSLTGLEIAGTIISKAWLAVVALSILTATTRLGDLTRGMEKLHAPRMMNNLLGFTYRYLFVLNDEARHLKSGRDVRYFSRNAGLGIRSVGFIAGSLFLRSYARGERVFGAMLLRGYDGQNRSLNPLRFKTVDLVFTLGSVSLVAGVHVAGRLL
jgi:cobalt/nickel transport system permease protein